jgi:SAM-dependent MidA family methyltransferase
VDPANQPLVDFIRARIHRDGPVSFAWFMEQALYHPDFGYYSSGQCQIGRRGDYFTNVSVGPLFGRILAAQFVEIWELMGRPGDFTVVEQGAHHGDFGKDVLELARERTPDFFAALQYCIVEPFPVLQARQVETLRDFEGRVRWEKSLAQLPPFSGIHFSNELLDAMPVHLVCREKGGDWQEKFVVEGERGFAFRVGEIQDDRLRRGLSAIAEYDRGRYETEVNLAALDWIETVSQKLERGFVLAVDYGFARPDFYSESRNTGTLQCYSGHRVIDSPLINVGRCDLTAHVEWTSVVEHAERSGLNLAGFTDQHHFITGMLASLDVRENERRALPTLMHPEFMGTRFQYLALSKNVPPAELSGFRFARDARKALGFV